MSTMIIRGAGEHDPSALEKSIERRSDLVSRGGACAVPLFFDGAVLLVAEVGERLPAARLEALAVEMRAVVVAEQGLVADEVAIVARGTLPRTASGTIHRLATADRHRRGELATLHLDRLAWCAPAPPLDGLPAYGATPAPLRPVASTEQAALTLEAMRRDVVAELEDEDASVEEDDDLIRLGLDSIRIMSLANRWRQSGPEIRFADLIERPTLAAWWALIESKRRAPAPDVGVDEVCIPDETVPFDLTPVQQAYWIGRRDDQVLGGVGCHFYFEMEGTDVDPQRLERAVRALFARHGMLRARFLADGRQQIMPTSPWVGVTVYDLRNRSDAAATRELALVRSRLSHRRLRVERGEVLDVRLSRLPARAHRLHVNVDLLVADVLSIRIMLEDLARLYARPEEPMAAIEVSFPQYLALRRGRRAEASARARTYWQARLAELPGAPTLPLGVDPARIARSHATRREHRLSPQARQHLSQRSRDHGVTLAMALATAFVETLATWSSEPRFLLNVPLFDRETLHPDVPRLVADFTNLILLEVSVGDECAFVERVRRLQVRFQADAAEAEYSGIEVMRDLARAHPGRPMPAPVVFTSLLGMGDLFGEELRRCFGEPGWMTSQAPQVWIDHQVMELDGGLLLTWDAVEQVFADGVLDAMFSAYVGLLEWLAAPECDWQAPTPALLPPAQATMRAAVNGTSAPESGRLLHEGFFDRAAERPERLALAWGEGGRMTYGELALRARRIAALLVSHGLTPGETVAITLPKGPDQVAAVLGVLWAGGVYVPVGVDLPAQRRARLYASAGTRLVLTGAAERAALAWPSGPKVVAVEEAAATPPLHASPPALGRDPLAYVIYTSGSTGEPKGVMIGHRAAVNTVEDVAARFRVSEADRVIAVSAIDFDLSVFDLFGLLSAGGTVVLVEEEARREPRRWLELVRRLGVTVWNSVPALLDMLLVAADSDAPPSSLRLALVSGDWVGLDLPGRLAARAPECRLVALGGATEAAIWSNAFEVTDVAAEWRSIPYGYPLRNQKFRVVDARGRDCPDWVSGELWIGGIGLAQGYRGDSDGTARRFVEHDGERWYRTGDVGRYWPDGTLEFVGRLDHQVKIRGHRIELGEIEVTLETHPEIAHAVVVAVGGPGRRLQAFVVPAGAALDAAALRLYLAERLPAHAVPVDYTVVGRLPLTANGKVDREALARLATDEPCTAADEPPTGTLETALAEVWTDLLDLQSVGRTQDFIALGGDSLLATRLVDTLHRRFGVELSLRQLFAAPTIAELAMAVAELAASETGTLEEGVA